MLGFISSSIFDFNLAYIIIHKAIVFIRQSGNLTKRRFLKYHKEEVVYFGNTAFKSY